MDAVSLAIALKAAGKTAEQVKAALDEYLEENPEALDQAAVEAIVGEALSVMYDELDSVKSAVDAIQYMRSVTGRNGYYSYAEYHFTVGHTYRFTNNAEGTVSVATWTTGDSSGTKVETVASNINPGEYYDFTPTLQTDFVSIWYNGNGDVVIVDRSIGLPKAENDIQEIQNELDDIPNAYVSEHNENLGDKTVSDYVDDIAAGLYKWVSPINILSTSYISGKNINASGELYDSANYAAYLFFPVQGGRKIICTRQASPTTRTPENALWAFYSDKNTESFISRITRSTNAVDVPSNAKYAQFTIQNDYAVGGYSVMVEYTDGTSIQPAFSAYFTPHYQFLQADFSGKKICAFGDSLAASDDGNRNNETWVDMVGNYFGCAGVYNRGIGGSCITAETSSGVARNGYAYVNAAGDAGENRAVYSTQRTFADYPNEINPCMENQARANTIPTDSDIIIIVAGTNDIGTVTLDGFSAAYRTMLNNIIARVPNAKIYPCTLPFQQTYDLGNAATKAIYDSYRDAIRAIAEDYGFPCIDLRRNMGINARNYTAYMNDTTHFNTSAGRKRFSECVIATLKGYSNLS